MATIFDKLAARLGYQPIPVVEKAAQGRELEEVRRGFAILHDREGSRRLRPLALSLTPPARSDRE